MRVIALLAAISLAQIAVANIVNKACNKNPSTCACTTLSTALPGRVHFPNSTEYEISNQYWSNRQAEIHPTCFITPNSTTDVSVILKTLTRLSAPFTVKSGGHTAFAGSNLVDGITIDLRLLTSITVSPDRRTVYVGAGNRWINISTALDPLGLAVVGGRVSDPGVGGLILGGGISYFSGRRGWACDNVRSYEIVLASGAIVTASPTSHRDLYWSLRGGAGTNFGIVTRFDLVAFEQPTPLWSGSLLFPGSINTTLLPLYQNLTVTGLPSDPDAHTYLTSIFLPSLGGYILLTDQYHATPPSLSDPSLTPQVFRPIASLPDPISHTTRLANLSTLLTAIDQPYGARQTWWNTAVRATSPSLLLDILSLHEAHVTRLLAVANGSGSDTITPFLTFQPIPVNVLQAMQTNGGNALGLEPADGPLMIIQSATTWTDKEIDGAVEASTQKFIDAVNDLARKRGLDNGFVYMNYAGKGQDVFGSYGRGSRERLRRVAREYDPLGELRRLWRGYFKLW
ncbi:hypothetical protein QBC47DRAFT_459771 [Echria macrotheca]|uniref:FAD-binding PCMH-type domain-containing protein n=1 Tax=Echria macrotheca TaxID=438768 RepID=A0AAJ0BF62_9PEZI|nr:hypothetical protein QBC47DRAFT_459771 [Echria macrotheca]